MTFTKPTKANYGQQKLAFRIGLVSVSRFRRPQKCILCVLAQNPEATLFNKPNDINRPQKTTVKNYKMCYKNTSFS